MGTDTAMGPLERAMADWAVEQLLPRLNNRMGNVLFIRACLPEVAIRLVQQGLFVTVVEHDAERLERFLAPIREEKLDRKVSVDARGYDGIEYQASSYNVVISWEGIPSGMEPGLFFKKVRRELKAGSNLYIKAPLKPVVTLPDKVAQPLRKAANRLPEKAKGKLDGWAAELATCVSLPDAFALADFQAAAAVFLKFEEALPLSLLAERVRLLPAQDRVATKVPEKLLASLLQLDKKLLKSPYAASLASSSLLIFSKSLEFGKVFRI